MKEVVLVEAEVVTERVQVGHANFLTKAFFVFFAIVPQVFQKGVEIIKEKLVDSLFHLDSLLQLLTLKTYFPGFFENQNLIRWLKLFQVLPFITFHTFFNDIF